MLAKKQKAKLTHFSSEDSQNTDHSMNSSLEIAESNAQNNHANKFNQLRETMNQLFLANPELAEEIKFERYLETGEPEGDSPRNENRTASPLKKPSAGSNDHLPNGNEEAGGNMASAKFWGAISKEMTKPQKNSKMPSINQINHILNIYKAKFEKPEQTEISLSPTKSVLKKPKSDFRIQSAKAGDNKQLLSARQKDGKQGAQNNSSLQEEGEDGVNYYSFRKKMHLKLKQKRIERELEEQKKKREYEAEQEKLAKELEEKAKMYTLAELDELKKGIPSTIKPDIEERDRDRPGDASTRHGTKIIKPRGSGSRKNSLKGKGDIFERLTKDFTNKNATTEGEEDNHVKRTFTSPFAESLYNDMKAFGDPEAFKKIAQARIMNYKKEFKEKLSKQKQLPLEGLRFSKDKSRHLNMFLPDFEKAAAFPSKDMIFNAKEIQKDSEEWKENADYETLAKFQKIRNGNILEFWQESKDLNQ